MNSSPRAYFAVTALVAGLALVASPANAQGGSAPQSATKVVTPPSGTVSVEAAGTVAPSAEPTRRTTGIPTQITIAREVFDYAGIGRRDPYKSLMSTSEIRPLLSDLRLTAVAFDPDGDNSVAILRDMVTKKQHRVKVGQHLGRLRVSNIKPKAVIFTIDEFGFNRQETLLVSSDTTKARTP